MFSYTLFVLCLTIVTAINVQTVDNHCVRSNEKQIDHLIEDIYSCTIRMISEDEIKFRDQYTIEYPLISGQFYVAKELILTISVKNEHANIFTTQIIYLVDQCINQCVIEHEYVGFMSDIGFTVYSTGNSRMNYSLSANYVYDTYTPFSDARQLELDTTLPLIFVMIALIFWFRF